MKFDMHCHTKEGSVDSKVPIEEYINILKSKGFDGMLVTDHDSYKGYNYFRDNLSDKIKDFVVLRGVEYDTIDAGHIIVIMPAGVELKLLEIKGMPIAFLIKLVHKKGGILGPAHPCGERFMSMFNTGIFRHQRHWADKFDFIEAYNSCQDEDSNNKAMELTRKYNKPGTSGSDAHWFEAVGKACTEIPADIRTEDDMIRFFKEGGETKYYGERFTGTLKDRIGFWNNILVYGFYPYNKLGALMKSVKRRVEIKKINHLFK